MSTAAVGQLLTYTLSYSCFLDYTVTFTLVDRAFKDYFPHGQGIDVRFFNTKGENLPPVSVGDVVLLRSIKVCYTNHEYFMPIDLLLSDLAQTRKEYFDV